MESVIAQELKGKYPPIAMLRSNRKPEDAIQPKASTKGGCVMPYIARVIAEGQVAVFDRDTCPCTGSVTGLGFGSKYEESLPGGIETYSAFFSHGMESAKNPDQYKAVIEKLPPHERPKFEKGTRFFRNHDRAHRWMTEDMPVFDFPEHYVIFKRLSTAADGEIPQSVTFTVNALELSALVTLDGSLRDGVNYTMTPQNSACQMLGAQVFRQAESEEPRAVIGLLDIASRIFVRKWIPDEYLTYTVPWKLFLSLEEEAKTGVFQSPIWQDLQKK